MSKQSDYYMQVKAFPLYVNKVNHDVARADIGKEVVTLYMSRGLNYVCNDVGLAEFRSKWVAWDEYWARGER